MLNTSQLSTPEAAISLAEHVSLLQQLEALRRDQAELQAKRHVDASLAHFANRMRWDANQTLETWADHLLNELVPYVDALQGALYIRAEDAAAIRRIGGYALPEEALATIPFGEGMAGQAAASQQTMYIDDPRVFKNQVQSGLAEIAFQALLIQPLVFEGETQGLLELSAVDPFTSSQMELLRALSSTMAANLASVRSQVRLQELYEEAQHQREQLMSQEEEMRQNVEELEATQEEMRRVQQAIADNEARLNSILNSSQDKVLVVDLNFQILFANNAMRERYVSHGNPIEIGTNMMEALPKEERDHWRSVWGRGFAGESFSIVDHSHSHAGDSQIVTESFFSPLRDAKGIVQGAVMYLRDITSKYLQDKQLRIAYEEMEAQQEELRQNLEELEATQEEMRRAQARVQEQQDLLNSLMDNNTDTIIAVDCNYNVLLFNKQLQQVLDQSIVRIEAGMSVWNLLPQAQHELHKTLFDRAFAGESCGEIIHYLTGDANRYFDTKFFPLRLNDGSIIGVASTARDISEAKQMQQRLERVNLDLASQEEELRQNLEELEAAQEEMHRVQKQLTEQGAMNNYLFDNSREGLVFINPAGKFMRLNRAAWQMYGFKSQEEALGKTFANVSAEFQLDGTSSADVIAQPIETCMREGHAQVLWQHRRPNGIAWIADMYLAKLDIAGKEGWMFLRLLDVTESHQNAMLLNETRLNSILDSSTDMVLVLNRQYQVMYVNAAMRAAYAAAGADLHEGIDMRTMVPPAEKALWITNWDRTLAGESFRVEEKTSNFGSDMYFQVDYSPVTGQGGAVIGCAIYTRDITRLKELEAKLASKKKPISV